jgi:hypothetical protein
MVEVATGEAGMVAMEGVRLEAPATLENTQTQITHHDSCISMTRMQIAVPLMLARQTSGQRLNLDSSVPKVCFC